MNRRDGPSQSDAAVFEHSTSLGLHSFSIVYLFFKLYNSRLEGAPDPFCRRSNDLKPAVQDRNLVSNSGVGRDRGFHFHFCSLASTPAMFNSTLTQDESILTPVDGSIMITGDLTRLHPSATWA